MKGGNLREAILLKLSDVGSVNLPRELHKIVEGIAVHEFAINDMEHES